MLGIAHVVFNTAVAVSLNMTVQQATGVAVGSLLPDLDTPQSTASRFIPGGQIGKIVLGGFLLFAGTQSKDVGRMALLTGLVLLASAFLPHRTVTHSLLGLGVISLLASQIVPSYWVYVAMGYAMHLAEDMLTPAGIPILWPIPLRPSFGIPSWIGNAILLAAGLFLIFR